MGLPLLHIRVEAAPYRGEGASLSNFKGDQVFFFILQIQASPSADLSPHPPKTKKNSEDLPVASAVVTRIKNEDTINRCHSVHSPS